MRLSVAMVAGVIVLSTVGEARAQGQNPTVGRPPALTPTVSPYVNLRRGGTTAINYFGIVRPQLQFRQSLGQLETRVQLDEAAAAADAAGASTLTTGHASAFFNYSHYFPSLSSAPSTPRRLSTTSSARPTTASSSHIRHK